MSANLTIVTATPDPIPLWIQAEYGWRIIADVRWKTLCHCLNCADHILECPEQFPGADLAKLARETFELHVFIAAHPDQVKRARERFNA